MMVYNDKLSTNSTLGKGKNTQKHTLISKLYHKIYSSTIWKNKLLSNKELEFVIGNVDKFFYVRCDLIVSNTNF